MPVIPMRFLITQTGSFKLFSMPPKTLPEIGSFVDCKIPSNQRLVSRSPKPRRTRGLFPVLHDAYVRRAA